MRALHALLVLAGMAAPAFAGDTFTGQWNGMVPASMQITGPKTLRICFEDLKLQCRTAPYTSDGRTLVVEHPADGLKWTYTRRGDGGYDAAYFRWDGTGRGRYKLLATAILTRR